MRITSPYKKTASLAPIRPAIVTERQTLSYDDWNKLVQRTAASFCKEPSKNRRVFLLLPNGYLFLQLFAGASEAGWASIVGDIRWKRQEIEERVKQVKPDLIIADSSLRSKVCEQNVMIIYTECIDEWMSQTGEYNREVSNVPFYIGFTSGSTGTPKPFTRSHESWIESFACNQRDLAMNETEHILIPGSFVNSTFLYGAISTLFLGGTIYILEKFSAKALLKYIETYPITYVYVVPTMLQSLLAECTNHEMKTTFISTGAKLLPHTKSQLKRQFPNVRIVEFYGASELSYVSYLKDEDEEDYAHTVGRPFNNVAISIRNDKGQEVTPGHPGKLYVKSKMLFDGYLHDEQATQDVKQGEWATVHDLAKLDENGYITILGRENDMILYGGINIYPQEIEQVLRTYIGVEEVAVVGVKDEYWGEKPAVAVKGTASITSLKRFCLENLASYKIPRIWRKVNDFPLTSGGKISRTDIKNWFENGG
ncbi:AMP-binding protein [Metabacillus malikii]|uniref:Long-chain acyl-CoA synthetase n=1 Tax=Metabacillus malikii TaxID=1504265 RepID=A0ABT9ZEK9_9BACI|nr:AMP-binding protein [Metabacillus malikii]MDQ0230709.1 long-chain acyl-CoA synthetase [Metabacillus malikii]